MTMIDEKTLTQFGIKLEDEFPHVFSEDHEDWNESYFFDWYDREGHNAGHCRIAWHPVQKRVLFWLYIFNGSEWMIIEEYRLPFSELKLNADKSVFSYSGWGLAFDYVATAALNAGKLTVSGFARVVSGHRQGLVLPVSLNLAFQALGPAHSRGAGTVENHSAEGFSTNRYEQPIAAELQLAIDADKYLIGVRGERDHSWGPRPWDMEWQFFVVNSEHFSLQSTVVNIPDWPTIQMGYYQATEKEMEHLSKVEFDLVFDAADPTKAVQGSFSLVCDSGRQISGRIETISGMEIDITHTFATPKRTEYRRSLVRCFIEGEDAVIGWLECNRQI
ncbi:hypothetical protein [Zhongshania aquimaris]|uniref:AttH domain-containing protein n=1 Tax=Zhongshania aquimaris TaxID=2857107 RepID=A0ABS6VS78_9GAMM|nr:hypothetical protein [Zhongshania aquimaris]MBW2941121.1 hypothetical protein [Zhongshania aquimaris]